MYSEDDLLPLSAIQHFLFCERQCALIHLERIWQENPFTAEGKILHERADKKGRESRGNIRIVRGLELCSLRLGLAGRADVVEFHQAAEPWDASTTLIRLPNAAGKWKPFPVEYKRGKLKPGCCDEAQLCAQAICLEEMLNISIEEGALFYHSIRRRIDVLFDSQLRSVCEDAARKLRDLMTSRVTPRPSKDVRCENCSLLDLCSPHSSSGRKSARVFVDEQVRLRMG